MATQIGDVVLEVNDLHTYFFNRRGVTKAVDGINFTLRQGETLGIVGESGCGKSMTALSLVRLIPRPAARIIQGEIILDRENLVEKTDEEMRQIRGRNISMILQDPQTSLNPVFTIGNQLIEALKTHGKGAHGHMVKRAVEALKSVRVAAPERRMDDFPHQMSGGMKQRVIGAIAISCAPKVIIADEPTTALDSTIQLQYLRLLKELQAKTGMAIIFITHDFGIVARMCDRVAVMYAGRFVEIGGVRDLFNNPNHPYTQALMSSVPQMDRTDRLFSIEGQPPALWDLPEGCRFAPRCIHAQDRCLQEYPSAYSVNDGHVASCFKLDPTWKEIGTRGTYMPAELLRAENLKKYFPVTKGLVLMKTIGYVQAVDGISFSINEGETLGLVGESGCGKTTTARLILRLEKPTEGRILLNDKDIQFFRGSELKDYRTQVQAVFQDPWSSLNPRMKAKDIVSEALVVNRNVSKQEKEDRVSEVMNQVGLRPVQGNNYPHEFSGGQRQRVAVAAALASYPQIIILDEPVSALDVSIRAQVMNLLVDLQEQTGIAFLLVAHNLATVRYMSHQTAVMYLGQIVEQAPTDELYDNVLHPYTKALFSAALPSHPDVQREEIVLFGEVPSPIDPPAGCRFHPRCPFAMDKCSVEVPQQKDMGNGHMVSCHLY